MPVSFKELLDAHSMADAFANDDPPLVCRATGRIYFQFDEGITGEPPDALPEDADDAEKYFHVPGKRELGLGKPLALAFAREVMAKPDFDLVRDIFSRSGAYKKFNALLRQRDLVDEWHKFSDEAEEQALRDWCAASEVELIE